jgi:ribonuclease P protein component
VSGHFNKGDRLLSGSDFAAVFKNAKRDQGPFFLVLYIPNSLKRARLGLAVSRKVSLKAVTRNKIKRQIRESFRLNKGQLGGLDIVVIARPASASADQLKINASIMRHWQKLTRYA